MKQKALMLLLRRLDLLHEAGIRNACLNDNQIALLRGMLFSAESASYAALLTGASAPPVGLCHGVVIYRAGDVNVGDAAVPVL